jgi:hypothetical protein
VDSVFAKLKLFFLQYPAEFYQFNKLNRVVVMVMSGLRIFILLVSALLLSSCFGPQTPQEVTQAFWQAVIHDDVGGAVKYSTLPDAKSYDGFSRDWHDYHPTWGRVTIDGNAASIVTTLSNPAKSDQGARKFITYLVKRNDQWIVDYDRTRVAVQGGALGNLLDTLNLFGNDLSRQLDATAENFKHEMDRMSRELEQMAKSFGDDASKSIDKFAEDLRRNIQELEDSINRALKDDKNLSDKDRHVLRVAAEDLEKNRKSLEEPTVDAISKCSKQLGNTQQQLEAVNSDTTKKYKQEWRELSRKIEIEMQKMLDELSSRLNGNTAS